MFHQVRAGLLLAPPTSHPNASTEPALDTGLPNAGFHNLDTTDILDWLILCWDVPFRMFNSIPSPNSLDAGSNLP